MITANRFRQAAAKTACFTRRIRLLLPAVMTFGLVLSVSQVRAAEQQENAAEATQLEDVRAEWSEAIESLKGYSVNQREAAVKMAGAALDEMDERIEILQQRTVDEWESLSAETREARLEALEKLVESREAMAEWYDDMERSSAEAWVEVREGFVSAYAVVQEAWADALEEFE